MVRRNLQNLDLPDALGLAIEASIDDWLTFEQATTVFLGHDALLPASDEMVVDFAAGLYMYHEHHYKDELVWDEVPGQKRRNCSSRRMPHGMGIGLTEAIRTLPNGGTLHRRTHHHANNPLIALVHYREFPPVEAEDLDDDDDGDEADEEDGGNEAEHEADEEHDGPEAEHEADEEHDGSEAEGEDEEEASDSDEDDLVGDPTYNPRLRAHPKTAAETVKPLTKKELEEKVAKEKDADADAGEGTAMLAKFCSDEDSTVKPATEGGGGSTCQSQASLT